MAGLPPGVVERFRRDGAAPLRGIVSPSDIEALRAGVDLLLAKPSPRAKDASAANDPGQFFEDFCNWRDEPRFLRFVEGGPLAAAAAELMGARAVRFYHDHVLVKQGGARTPTPWHQDQPYYNIDGRQTVSFWIPLDQ